MEVVYGTTNLKMATRIDDLFISKASEMAACGLDRATRFDLDQVVWLPWASEWFEALYGYSSPIIGSLTPNAIKMLQVSLSFKQMRQAAQAAAPLLPLPTAKKPTP